MQGPCSRQHGFHRHTLWCLSGKLMVPTFHSMMPFTPDLCTASALTSGALVA